MTKTKKRNLRKRKTLRKYRLRKTRRGGMFRNTAKSGIRHTMNILEEYGKNEIKKIPSQKDIFSVYEKKKEMSVINNKVKKTLPQYYSNIINNENINPNINLENTLKRDIIL